VSRKTALRFIILAAVIAGVAWVIVNRDALDVAELEAWVLGFGIWAPLVFIALYAAAAPLGAPGSALTLAGGVLFGPAWGSLYSLVGATAGATIAFLIARYVAADWVASRTKGILARVIEGIEAEGWRFVVFVRLVPLFPYNVLNYALGATRIKLSHYVIASFVAMAPGGVAYTYLGYAGREIAGGGSDWVNTALIAVAAVAAVTFIPLAIRRWRLMRKAAAGCTDSPT
jgi:uncharacterized membrane protein YdjX (TVP38/TMEM64 family)